MIKVFCSITGFFKIRVLLPGLHWRPKFNSLIITTVKCVSLQHKPIDNERFEEEHNIRKRREKTMSTAEARAMNFVQPPASEEYVSSLLRWRDFEVEADVDAVVRDRREHPHIVRAQQLR
jgi:hypothetical protein